MKKQDFCHIFFTDGISIGGAPPSYAYDCNFKAICDTKILYAFLIVCSCVYVKATIVVLFCMIMLKL